MNTLNSIIFILFVLFTDHTMSESSLRTATHKGLSLKEVYRPDKKGPSPEFLVEVSINAEPLESVAIYYALDYQQNYVPGVIKSVVTNQPDPLEAITDYEFETSRRYRTQFILMAVSWSKSDQITLKLTGG